MSDCNELKLVYKQMYLIRYLEEQIAKNYADQEMRCPVHLSIGQEATAVGVCMNLSSVDKVLSAHRSHAHYLAKGGDIFKMLAELYGKDKGCARGKGGSMHLFDLNAGLIAAVPIVGSTIPIGVGVALGLRRLNKKGLVVIYFGDGASEEGVFAESLDFAALKKLPILFVCENNQYSVYTHLRERQFNGRDILSISKAHGVHGERGDGNDVLEVLAKSKKAIDFIKKRGQPFLLELKTYRWLEHCGPNWDDQLGYRKKGELKKWLKRCPIKLYENYLVDQYKFNNKDFKSLRTNVEEKVNVAFTKVKKSDFPKENELFENIYA